MDGWLMAGALVLLLAASWILTRVLRPRDRFDRAMMMGVWVATTLLFTGYGLSALEAISRPSAWLIGASAWFLTALLADRLLRDPFRETIPLFDAAASPPTWNEKLALGLVGATVAVVGGIKLCLVIGVTPSNVDSLMCHLPRTAHYFQRGSLAPITDNFWAQTMHPLHQPIFLLFAFLLGGETLTQAVQFACFLGLGLGLVSLNRRLGVRPAIAWAVAGVGLLCINVIAESTTNQNDLIIAASLCSAIYFLFTYRLGRSFKHLLMFGLSLGIMLGVKASAALTVPSLAILVGWACWPQANETRADLARTVAGLGVAAVAALVLLLPAGYLQNWRTYGHPVGAESVRKEHMFEGVSASVRVKEGVLNGVRFLIDAAKIDGMPANSDWHRMQQLSNRVFAQLVGSRQATLERKDNVRVPFHLARNHSSHEDTCWFGPFGWWLGVAVLMALFFVRSSWPRWLFALASVVFFASQCFEGPYDPWRGRYFVWSIPLLVPVLALSPGWFRSRFACFWLAPILLLGCTAAICAVAFRADLRVLSFSKKPESKSVFQKDRIDQLTRGNRDQAELVRRYENAVPAGATVGVMPFPMYMEYFFFGSRWDRRIIPITDTSALSARQGGDLDFLVFPATALPPEAGDHRLGQVTPDGPDLYVRSYRN